MMKTVFRYFFDFVEGQEKWLNQMARKGYRLKKCGKVSYVFESCHPYEYEYAVEFVADKSHSQSKDYRQYLESMGFRTFTKNINLNFSVGKVRWRPYAKGMGQIVTSPGGINQELFIVEKRKDGKPFKLHTDLRDLISNYRVFRNSYLWAAVCMFALATMTYIPSISDGDFSFWMYMFRIVVVVLGGVYAIPAIKYSSIISRLKDESKTNE